MTEIREAARAGQGIPLAEAEIDVRVARRFGRFRLDVAFATKARRVVLFGPSGAGKSLTLRMIAGIVRPASGRIVIGGRVLYDSEAGTSVPAHRRRVGYVPQGYALFPHLTVEENVGFGLAGLSAGERRARVAAVLQMAGLRGLEAKRPHQLSGGQQQRVALARALAIGPAVLLLDEPFSAVDAPLRAGLRGELADIQARAGAAMITVTHDIGDAFGLADWMVVIDAGRVLQQGPKDDVYYRPATLEVARLAGIRNILPGVVEAAGAEALTVRWNGQRLTAARPAGRWSAGDRVFICIRSTQLMIRRPEDTTFGDRPNLMCGTIVEEGIVAETRRLWIRLQGSGQGAATLEIDLPEYTYFRLGLDSRKEIEMYVRPERVHIMPADRPVDAAPDEGPR